MLEFCPGCGIICEGTVAIALGRVISLSLLEGPFVQSSCNKEKEGERW